MSPALQPVTANRLRHVATPGLPLPPSALRRIRTIRRIGPQRSTRWILRIVRILRSPHCPTSRHAASPARCHPPQSLGGSRTRSAPRRARPIHSARIAINPPERPDGSITPGRRKSWLYVALRGPPNRLHARRVHAHHPNHPSARKAHTVRLRLHGTPDEIAATLTALRQTLDIATISRTYPDRPPSTLHRVYLDATLLQPAKPRA
jgi:hypothetical protein